MNRCVESELLDQLPVDDPRAVRSRGDLRRLNALMGNVGVLTAALRAPFRGRVPRRVADLGAGDGSVMLGLARRLCVRWRNVEVALVDRQAIIGVETCRQFEALSWTPTPVRADVFEWLARSAGGRIDLITANLFLHHFDDPTLARLLQSAAERTNCFAACEPRRYPAALRASRWLWLIGCNAVTRHDAVVSVRAGFRGEEISALWPRNGAWQLQEKALGLFSHCFVAQRRAGSPTSNPSNG